MWVVSGLWCGGCLQQRRGDAEEDINGSASRWYDGIISLLVSSVVCLLDGLTG